MEVGGLGKFYVHLWTPPRRRPSCLYLKIVEVRSAETFAVREDT